MTVEKCTNEQQRRFLRVCPEFETHVSEKEEKRRFETRIEDPLRQWKLSPMDLPAREPWYHHSRARDMMLEATDTEHAPWYLERSATSGVAV